MAAHAPRPDDDPGSRERARLHSPGVLWTCGVLLALAVVLPLWVPSYARETPTLWGFPFFYWYQLLWVFICAALVSTAHFLMRRDEARHRARHQQGAPPGSRPGPSAPPVRGDGAGR